MRRASKLTPKQSWKITRIELGQVEERSQKA